MGHGGGRSLFARADRWERRVVEREGANSSVTTPSTGVEAGSPSSEPIFRTFLIGDIRGYTRFTREHGSAAAARLAKAFADLARDAVEARRGDVFELRGDEVVAV